MHLELLVEEPSVEAFLRIVLPRFLRPTTTFEIYPFNGKFDLLSKLSSRLRGYRRWIDQSDTVILILVDRDDADCRQMKMTITEIVKQTGLSDKSTSPDDWRVATRVICEELEAWYFGDWEAVRLAYPEVPPTIPNRAPFRNSDEIRAFSPRSDSAGIPLRAQF